MLELIERHPESTTGTPPLLFVHGAWHAAWCWEEFVLPYVASHGYDCYALSMRGHGASSGGERLRWTRIRDYVDDVAEVASQLPAMPVLIGHSAGGFVVQKYLEGHVAAGAVLITPIPPTGAARIALKILRRYPRRFLRANLRLSLLPLVDTPEVAQALFFSASMPADQVAAYQQRLQDESYRCFLDLVALDLVRRRKLRRVPMLVLGAGNDFFLTRRQVRRTAELYGADREIFPDMAHDLMLEADWKLVADRMVDWLGERF
jgi:pimeloyl-ACP methyl ester carboxylesterase